MEIPCLISDYLALRHPRIILNESVKMKVSMGRNFMNSHRKERCMSLRM
jgi:hypothetical protein